LTALARQGGVHAGTEVPDAPGTLTAVRTARPGTRVSRRPRPEPVRPLAHGR